VIINFANKLAEDLFEDKSSKAVRAFPPELHRAARRKLQYIHEAAELNDLKVPPGNRLGPLKGERNGFHSIRINDQWRIDSFRKGYQRGQPDLLILNRHKKWTGLCIELKTPACTGVVSPDQQRFLDRLECSGYKVLVSNDYDFLLVEIQNYFKDVRTYCKHCDRWVAKKHTHPEA
jgi:proteic killer suppression protein